jgi:hypothetical protein
VVVTDDLPQVPEELRARAERWFELKRWERRELGQELRRAGLSYNEIARIIPVHDGTLSAWCRDIELNSEQRARIASIRPRLDAQMALGRKRREAALGRKAAIRSVARQEVCWRREDPFWVAGVVAYWSEGAKRDHGVRFSNSDPDLVRIFVDWARSFLDHRGFSAALHLHSGQDEHERIEFWAAVTGITPAQFRKTYVKREGTGHRKNRLYNGTITIRLLGKGDELQRVLGWIEGLSDLWGTASMLRPGR